MLFTEASLDTAGEELYTSATTRVFRVDMGAPLGHVICKEHIGADGGKRCDEERAMLVRLAGVAGVAQLMPGNHPPRVLVLRDCKGALLAQALGWRALDPSVLLPTALQLAATLAAVHRRGVIHGDINPWNILLSPDGTPLLIDFDRSILAEPGAPPPTGEGRPRRLSHMAPEQTGRTGHPVDQRADLYSLGATLYEMATGHPPFKGDDALQLIHAHLVLQPSPPSQLDPRVPSTLSAIILRLMAKAPEQRYESLEQRVQARTRELQETQARLLTAARQAGKAEIASNVLHNVGNVLNSVNVSAHTVRTGVNKSGGEGLTRAVALLNSHEHDLANFIVNDPRGRAVLGYLNQLDIALRGEREGALAELDRLTRSVDHIAQVVSAQQSHAGLSSLLENVQPQELLEEALRMCGETIGRMGLIISRRHQTMPATPLDKPRLLQILVNLIGNAAHAMECTLAPARILTVSCGVVRVEGLERLRMSVQDSGEGITAQNLKRLFAHGFTTRETGHGFGLHSSALAAAEVGGRITAHSDGPGRGATFTLELPLSR